MRAAYERIRVADRPEVWISLRPEADALADAERVDAAVGLPLAGTIVAVKDNIDVAGLATTAGCPAFAYEPEETAPAVKRLLDAGAVVIGKTNLDQFATGLVGTRSPYGAVRNAWDPELVAGGSSSGSAVAVALGMADIGVGTDTAGSGRIPAAFQGIVGLKPTRGTISTLGVVPACRSYDCVSVFARTIAEAEQAVALMTGRADGDPFQRDWPADAPLGAPAAPAVAVPLPGQLGELPDGWAEAFEHAVGRLAEAGARVVPVDVSAFLQGADLLYGTALVAERYAAVGAFVEAHPGEVDPSVAAIVLAARDVRAHELVRDRERVEWTRLAALAALAGADALLLPTAPEHPTIAAVEADPLARNLRLGRFASFANLFDMCALAVPASGGAASFGVTVFAPPFHDRIAADIARMLSGEPARPAGGEPAGVSLLVLGAHLSGQPLNHQLLAHGGRFLRAASTRPLYRMFALDTVPAKPGLLHVGAAGARVEGELWLLPPGGLGAFLALLPAPMTLGAVQLEDGTQVTGFFCQASATAGAADISAFGGWRAYLASLQTAGAAR